MTERYRAFLGFFLVIALLVHVPLTVSAQATQDIHGQWVGDIPVEGETGDPCHDPSGVLIPGNTVTLSYDDGLRGNEARLRSGHVEENGACAYEFTLLSVSEVDEYFIDLDLGGRAVMEPQRLSLSRLKANDWQVRLTIQTSVYLEATGGNPAPTATTRVIPTIPPLDQPDPTATTAPTSIEQSGNLTTDEAMYLGQMGAWTNMATASLDNIALLVGSPRFGVPEWEHDIVAETGIWSAIYDQVRQTVPPARFAPIHDHLEAAYESLDQSGFHLRRGIETYDVSEIELATQYIQDFTQEIEEATEDVDGLIPGTL